MKIKNSQIILVIATSLGVYLLLAGYLSLLDSKDIKVEENNLNDEIILEIEDKNEKVENIIDIKIQKNQNLEPVSQVQAKDEIDDFNKIKVSLGVLDKSYELEIKENSSVFEMMKELETNKIGEFSFNYKEYPSMGVFVYEINGTKENRGSYWIYYVNEKEASVGVSNYILKEGDSILWKQE